ncbi:cytochrome c [Thiohalophilus sp.]|uniref:c-type cytochrome n=1 Tax=Thiohalophilus sp. TaxID=3028392 RepID=UPI002ACE87B4|nr:cytochrome c [Thiohalophilus sp.]MDZ7663319.1 cytochrome c [Thiohalophilus sp.]
MWCRCLLACLLLIGLAPAHAVGEHGRRFAAEIAVMRGDVEQLRAADTRPLHRRGLRARLESSLSLLGMLARQQAQERGVAPARLLARVATLRDAYRQDNLERLRDNLRTLMRDYPLSLPEWDDPAITPARLAAGRKLYETLCLACHHHPYQDRENPAYNLFRQARNEPREIFAARLYGGVRGVPATSLDNPLSIEEMTALLVWLLEAPEDQIGDAD